MARRAGLAERVARGQVWQHTFKAPDKQRPVVVLSRDDVIDLLSTVIVAPITSTIRGLPSEVRLGVDDGMKRECAVNLDHVQTVYKKDLGRFVATLRPERMSSVCAALATATGCVPPSLVR